MAIIYNIMGDKMFIYIRNKKNNSFIKEFLKFCDCLTEAKTLKPIGNKYFRVNINDKNYKKYIKLFGNIIVQDKNEIKKIEKGINIY